MKCVSMLTVCGLFGVYSLGGMNGEGLQESGVPKLYQLSAIKVASKVMSLDRVGNSGIIDWGNLNIPSSTIKLIMEEVSLDKDTIIFWLSNLVSLEQQKKDENRMFAALSEQGIPILLDLELNDFASFVLQDTNTKDLLNLSSMIRLLPSVTINKKKQNPFPASVGRHQRFFNQPLVVNCNGMNASLDRDSGNLIIAYQDDIKLVIPTHNDDLKRATALRFNNNNADKFVAGFKGGKVSLYDTADNSEKEITGHSLAVTAVALSPDEDIIASASINGELCLSSISAGTHVKMWVDNLVSNIDFEGDKAIKLTMDRVDGQIVNKSVPLQYLKGKLTNKELLVAYIVKRIKDQNEAIKHTTAAELGLFMDTNKLFEPVMREYFRGVITGKDS